MKLALEERLGVKVPAGSNLVTFLAEYAAYLLNRLEVGKDGKTAVERSKAKSASVLGIEFGEKLMFKKRVKDKAPKIESRWEEGIFVGVHVSSGECWVSTPEGVKKRRSVRRLPLQDRWSNDSLAWVRHVPWHLYRGDAGADGEIPEEQLVDPEPLLRGGAKENLEREGITLKTRPVVPRGFQIRKEDAEKHGYSRGCAGCSSLFRGLGRQPHSPQCRSRFESLLKDDARFQNAERRKQEFESKIREKAAKKARKEEERGTRRPRDEGPEGRREPASASSAASSSSGPAAPPVHAPAEGGQMEVDGTSSDREDSNTEFWGPLLKKLKGAKEGENMGVSLIAKLLEEMEGECSKYSGWVDAE
jgi:hypothetical protein